MWNRKALKRQGKAAFRRNYWKSVLVALLLIFITAGAASSGSSSSLKTSSSSKQSDTIEEKSQDHDIDGWEYKDDFSGSGDDSFSFGQGGSGNGKTSPYGNSFEDQFPDNSVIEKSDSSSSTGVTILWLFGAILIGLAVIAAFIAVRIFVGNPLEIGGKRFFLMNLKQEPAEVKEVAYVFDHSWKNAGTVLFFRDLYVFLWSLLFVIPGIVKSYEYRMIPYLLAEHPEMPKDAAFAVSRQMMRGNKWKTFVLDLSFIGWHLLSLITVGIVGYLYVNPYKYSTGAALYAALRYGQPQPAGPVYGNYGNGESAAYTAESGSASCTDPSQPAGTASTAEQTQPAGITAYSSASQEATADNSAPQSAADTDENVSQPAADTGANASQPAAGMSADAVQSAADTDSQITHTSPYDGAEQ